MKCFISSDKAAVNASRLYNVNLSSGHYWDRADHPGPLPNCSSSRFPPPNSSCLVCRAQDVFAVCNDLPDDVEMVMDSSGRVNISNSTCPPLAADVVTDPSWDPTLTIIIICVIVAIIFILGVVGFLCYRRRKNCRASRSSSNGVRRQENGTNGVDESFVLNEVTSGPDRREEDEASSASILSQPEST